MPDRKPPRLAGDERRTILALLQYQRESLARKVEGLDDAAARRSPVASGTSLLWLLRHMARAEVTWVVCRFAAREVDPPSDTVEPGDTLDAAVDAYRAAWETVDEIVAGSPNLDDPCRGLGPGEEPANLRWVLLHLLEETARHAGHADILAELIDGRTGR